MQVAPAREWSSCAGCVSARGGAAASHGASLLDDGTILVTGGFRKAADGCVVVDQGPHRQSIRLYLGR
jgi:hypothetical protein